MELPARSRTRALALGKLREDGCMPSIRVVPPKYDIGPWMGIRCLFYSMELSYGSGMKIFLTYVLQQLYRIKTFAQNMYALMQEA